MRRDHVCPKCRGTHILLIARVPDTGEFEEEIRDLHVAVVTGRPGLVWGHHDGRAGRLNAAVCKACGYTEFYTEDAASIPVDGTHVREVVGPKTS